MNVGDMVKIREGNHTYLNTESVGVIVGTRTLIAAKGNRAKSSYLKEKNIDTHEVYWSGSGKVMWIMALDLEKAI